MLKKELQVEDIYRMVEQFPKDIRFLAGMCNLVWEQGAQYLSVIEEQTCLQINPPPRSSEQRYTRYDNTTFEYLMWMTSLTSMCWLLTNVKKKAENGHCHNPIHKETVEQTSHAGCPIGSAFHSRFYDALIASLDHLVTYARQQRLADR